MYTYQTKPAKVTAVQLTVENAYDVMTWANNMLPENRHLKMEIRDGLTIGLIIHYPGFNLSCPIGNYIKTEASPVYGCDIYSQGRESFEEMYVRVDDSESIKGN